MEAEPTGSTPRKGRNVNLDILRLMFAVFIVFHHFGRLDEHLLTVGYLSVDFFFFVAGYMLISQYKAGESSVVFMKHMFKKLLPVLVSSEIIVFIVCSQIYDYTPIQYVQFFSGSILESMGLHLTYIPIWAGNGILWFMSGYFICLAFIHPIIGKIGKDTLIALAPVMGVMIAGFLYFTHGSIAVWDVPDYKYFLLARAFADVLLGIGAEQFVDKMRNLNFTVFGKWVLTFVEVVSLIIITLSMTYYKLDVTGSSEYLILILIFVLTILVLSQQSYLSIRATDRISKVSIGLSSLSILIYVSHDVWFYNHSTIFPDLEGSDLFVVLGLAVLATIVCTYVLSKIIVIMSSGLYKWMVVQDKGRLYHFDRETSI